MKTDLSLVTLVIEASILVQLVLLILLVASIASWYFIFRKRSQLALAQRTADSFEEAFWSGGDLVAIFQRLDRKDAALVGIERIFHAGFREFAKLRQQKNIGVNAMIESTERVMRITLNREIDALELHLAFLATVGSTSPYVGLFGTVWGIMNSFRALGNVQQATLAMVAPGIAEALIATAMGLFAAIPAVIAYNRYATQIERLHSRYDIFKEEFTSILERQDQGS
ncbi:MAG: biopolymer transport protein TolQ [Gammaproteobacteria bacterium]